MKFLSIFAGLIILGVGVLLVVRYYVYTHTREYKISQHDKAVENQYQNDPYGGDTPEKTLRLFIEALKKGETDLASKYFVLDEQQLAYQELMKTKDSHQLARLIHNMDNALLNKTEVSSTTVHFEYNESIEGGGMHINEKEFSYPPGEITQVVEITLSPNKKWKITSF